MNTLTDVREFNKKGTQDSVEQVKTFIIGTEKHIYGMHKFSNSQIKR